ncbi:ATP-binding protein [Maridesulfovibrio sp. FT414]|uniref:ATP-binding protein n=1 Tax=Maridesulfovibrio sp. FT414 TaxID=2979469 RepID=UPI003D8036FD
METAIADLIDNSITAHATEIEVVYDPTQETLVIYDNGEGMSPSEVLSAMKHGAANPGEARAIHDLGRFGLGLKTASFSQCRRLTVASLKKGTRSSVEWDLDLVDTKDDWIVKVLDDKELQELPYINEIHENGTIVIWRNLDRLYEGETGIKREELVSEKLNMVEKHLALVFHRYLAGEIKRHKKLTILINGHKITPFDPFCRNYSETQHLPEEIVRVNGSKVRIQPYILPHHSKLSAADYDFYKNRSDFISNQGAYIYRNGRLMAWGDWFRIIPKGEATKLARVQIDFTNCMDEVWTIDIKKSKARPPLEVRNRLRQIIARISTRSTRVHQGRGEKLYDEIKSPIWERYADQGNIRYDLNHDHPLVQTLTNILDKEKKTKLKILLEAIPSALPLEMIYSDYSTCPKSMSTIESDKDDIEEKMLIFKNVLVPEVVSSPEDFKDILRSTRLFEDYPDIVDNFIQREF